MRLGIALKSMKQHEHRGILGGRLWQGKIDLEEIAIGRFPALPPVQHPRQWQQARGHDGLQVRARQPPRRAIRRQLPRRRTRGACLLQRRSRGVQWTVPCETATSTICPWGAGAPECMTIFQPAGVLRKVLLASTWTS